MLIRPNTIWILPLTLMLSWVALAQDRESAPDDEEEEYINLPEIVVKGERWRLKEEDLKDIWRKELEELEQLEEEQRLRKERDKAVASRTTKGGRWKLDVLPQYNPEKKLDEINTEGPPVEVTQFFRASF